MRIFLLQFCQFSVILWFNFNKILDLERNDMNAHFFFSELLILREKKIRGFFWSTKENYKFSKNIEKTPYRRVFTKKRYNFAPGASNHTFVLTHPVYLQNLLLFIFTKPSPLYIFTKPSPFYFYKTFFSLYLY